MIDGHCINLDHRTDRWIGFEESCLKFDVPIQNINRFPAIRDENFGGLGCAKSHLLVTASHLSKSSAQILGVFEDDFRFARPWGDLVDSLDLMAHLGIDWDVLLLSGTFVIASSIAPARGIHRAHESQTASGYLVKRGYCHKLLHCYSEAVRQMELYNDSQTSRSFIYPRMAIDQWWKPLQRTDKWFITSPQMGAQEAGYSDIEKRETNYQV
jgi:glycosyl transferase family 25